MRDPSPLISELPLIGPGAESTEWPVGIERGACVFKRKALSVWGGKSDGTDVGITVLDEISESSRADFLDAARRLEATVPLSGVITATGTNPVDPGGRWVMHTPVVGELADFPGLGWKLPRKLEL